MNLKEKRERKENRKVTMVLIPIVAVLGKVIQLFILPDKYFFDSQRMLGMMIGLKNTEVWGGYEETVNIFKKIDFFHFTTTAQWSVELGIVFTILFMIILSKVKEMSIPECIYTLMATALLNIYAFNLAKEPIQMFYFLCIMIVIFLPIPTTLRLIGCILVYFWESKSFREYYILMAALCVIFYFAFYLLKKVFKRITKFKVVLIAILCFLSIFALVFATQFVDRESYNEVMTAKTKHSNEGATSAITNLVGGDGSENFGNFMINYVINAVRMMIPIELIFKSPGYFPFFIYQIFILTYWIRAIKNIKRTNDQVLLALVCFTAYIFGSFTFEPDFGSWVRHESASFPVFYILAYEYLGQEKDEKLQQPTEIVYEAEDF